MDSWTLFSLSLHVLVISSLFWKFFGENILLQNVNGISPFILGDWFHWSTCQAKEKFLCCEGFVQIPTPVPSKTTEWFFSKLQNISLPFLLFYDANEQMYKEGPCAFFICPCAGDWFIFSFSRTSKISDIKMTWAIFVFIRIKFHLSLMVSNPLPW